MPTQKLTRPCTGAIPESVGNLTKLKTLWLNNNEFEGSC